jgi:hypothetical protein
MPPLLVEMVAPAMDQKLITALKRAHTLICSDDIGLPVIERRPITVHPLEFGRAEQARALVGQL